MKTYIAYFDILGFTKIVENNPNDYVDIFMDHFYRETEKSLSPKYVPRGISLIPDLTTVEINCLHYSDSVIFWTNTDSDSDFEKIVNVCYTLYWRSLQVQIPIRGCLTFGDLKTDNNFLYKGTNANFISACIYGKAYIEAYKQGEGLQLSACLLGDGLIEKIGQAGIQDLVKKGYVCAYLTPQKGKRDSRYLFRPIDSYSELGFYSACRNIIDSFTKHTKEDINNLPEDVQIKLNNTIEFLKNFKCSK